MAIVGLGAHQTSATAGTGTYDLDADVDGALTLVQGAAIESGDNVGPWQVEYVARSGADIENGLGTLTAGAPATLSRDTIIRSTNGNAAISWGGGTRDVFLAPGATTLSLLSEATADADPETVARRDASGRLRAASPTESTHLTTKGYVDAADVLLQGAAEDAQADADAAQAAADAAAAAGTAHAALTNNPHAVTKAQVGLGDVLNFAQLYLTAATVGAAGSLAFSNGTTTFGLKWGAVAGITAGASAVVTYPAAFPTATLAVMTQFRNSSFSGANSVTVGVHSETAAGFTIYNNASMTVDLFWFAIGH